MDAYVFRFHAKDLKSIEPRCLGFMVASGHCCNELMILMPYIIFEQMLLGTNEVEEAFILVRQFTVERIIISKIVEYGDMCEEFFGKEFHQSDPWIKELSSKYEPIRRKLKLAKWARILRNKSSFHYDQKHAHRSLMDLQDDFPLRLVAGRLKGNVLFDFAEEAVSRPIYEEAGGGNIGQGMEVAREFLNEMAAEITDFHAQATISLFKKYNVVTTREPLELREKYCGVPRRARIPISISSKYLYRQAATSRTALPTKERPGRPKRR